MISIACEPTQNQAAKATTALDRPIFIHSELDDYRHPAAYQVDGGRVGARQRGSDRGPERGTRLIIPGDSIPVSPILAVKLGINKAIFLQQINYCLIDSKHHHDGCKWVYNTHEGWRKFFPYWSANTIQRLVSSLRDDDGLIITTDRYNRRHNDRTLWFTINVDVFTAMFGTPPSYVGQAKVTPQLDKLLSDVTPQLGELHDQSPRTPSNSTEMLLPNLGSALPKKSTKRSTKTKKPTNHARNETQREPQPMDGGWVASTTDDGFGLTRAETDLEQSPCVTENAPATNRADTDAPPLRPPPKGADEDLDPAALMVAVGISPNVAAKLARQDGCTVAKVERVIEGWKVGCKRREFSNPPGALCYRLAHLDQFGGEADADEDGPNRYYLDIIDPSNPSYAIDEGPPAAAAVENVSPGTQTFPAIEPAADEDPLIAHWPETCATELGNLGAELEHSRLIALAGGGYQLVIAAPVYLERVQLGQWMIKRALRGQPFVLSVAGDPGGNDERLQAD